MFRDFKIMAFQHVSGICRNYDKNILERQSTYYQTVLKFHISHKEMFSNSVYLGLMKNYDESAGALISAVIFSRENLDSRKVFQNGSVRAFK